MALRQKHIEVYYLGGLLLLSTIIGGGASKFLYTDFLLQVLVLPALVWALYRYRYAQAPKLPLIIILILSCVFAPVAWTLAQGIGHTIGTVDIGRTLDSAAFVIAMLAVFCFSTSLAEIHRARAAQFFLVGVAINFAFSLAQFSAKSPEITIPGFPHIVRGGFFEVENHLSALFFVSIPFVILAFKNTTWWFLSLPLAVVIALYQFVFGSIAGVAIGFVCLLTSIAALTDSRTIRILTSLAALLGAAGLLYFVPDLLKSQVSKGTTWSAILQNTLSAISHYLPLGSGFGTFTLVYPAFGAGDGTNLNFPDHVQNDFLELTLEGGAFAGLLLAAYVAGVIAMAVGGELSDFQKSALMGIVILLIHSSFGFPLRTMALTMVFAYLNAIVFGPLLRPLSPDD